MTQVELERFRTEIEVARDMGDVAKVKAAELAFTRRLQECQVHTGQRVKRHGEQITELRSEMISLRVDFKAEIATLRKESEAGDAALRKDINDVKTELRELKTQIETVVNLVKWIVGFLGVGGVATLVKVFAL